MRNRGLHSVKSAFKNTCRISSPPARLEHAQRCWPQAAPESVDPWWSLGPSTSKIPGRASLWKVAAFPGVDRFSLFGRVVGEALPASVSQSHRVLRDFLEKGTDCWVYGGTFCGSFCGSFVFFLSFCLMPGCDSTGQVLLFPCAQTCWKMWGCSGISKRRNWLWVSAPSDP